MESSAQTDESPNELALPRVPGVPRRYGVGTLLLITAMYAVLFSFLRWLQVPVAIFVIVVAFTTLVGLGQMFLFKGKEPLRASIWVGMVFFFVPTFGIVVFGLIGALVSLPHHAMSGIVFTLFAGIGGTVAFTWFGGVVGYFTGLAIGGVFWVVQEIETRLAVRRSRAEKVSIAENES